MAEKKVNEELKKVLEKAKGLAEQKKLGNGAQLKAVEDEALDSVAGGYFDESIHEYVDSWYDEDDNEVIEYNGVDTCSYCGRKQASRFIEFPVLDFTTVMCDTCRNKLLLTGDL